MLVLLFATSLQRRTRPAREFAGRPAADEEFDVETVSALVNIDPLNDYANEKMSDYCRRPA